MFHLQCQVKDLLAPLNRIHIATGTAASLPIVGQVLLEGISDSNDIDLTRTDMSLTMRVRAPTVRVAGDVLLPADKLQEILKLLPPDADLTIDVDTLVTANLTSGKSRWRLNTLDPLDFPGIGKIHTLSFFLIDGDLLGEMLRRVEYAQAHKDPRDSLNGVMLDLQGGMVSMIATNGHVLAVARCADVTSGQQSPTQAIIPTRVVKQISKLANLGGSIAVHFLGPELGSVPTMIEVTGGPLRITAHLIDGKYPDYTRVLPDSSWGWLEADRAQLLQVCRQVLICAAEDLYGVSLQAAIDDLVVSATNSYGENATVALPIERGGGLPDRFALNGKYLSQTLAAVDCERIRLKFRGPLDNVEVTMPEQTDWRVLISPIRL